MTRPLVRFALFSLAALLSACVFAEAPSAKIKNPPSSNGFVFSLFPRSFQNNPHTDFTAICEMTEEGRKRPVATKDNLVSYIAHNGGFFETGEDHSNILPSAEAMEGAVRRALAVNGFVPVTEGKKPDLVLIYHWGAHTINLSGETIGMIMSRALLIGGVKFAKELEAVLKEQSQYWTTSNVESSSDEAGPTVKRGARDEAVEMMKAAVAPTQLGQEAGAGASSSSDISSMMLSITPIERFKRRDARTQFLVEQCLRGIYFVVISAFDYEAMAKNKKVLLWRARLSLDSNGLSISDAIPALLGHSAPFLGRDMDVPATDSPRMMRGKDKVQIGEATVVPDEKSK